MQLHLYATTPFEEVIIEEYKIFMHQRAMEEVDALYDALLKAKKMFKIR